MNQLINMSARWRLFFCMVLWLGFGAGALGQSEPIAQAESAKINCLLGSLGSLKDAEFLRNGAVFSAAEAVAHLRFKWRAAGARVVTARDFIREVATKSSVSGAAYRIRFPDGREVSSAEFLQKQLLACERDRSGP